MMNTSPQDQVSRVGLEFHLCHVVLEFQESQTPQEGLVVQEDPESVFTIYIYIYIYTRALIYFLVILFLIYLILFEFFIVGLFSFFFVLFVECPFMSTQYLTILNPTHKQVPVIKKYICHIDLLQGTMMKNNLGTSSRHHHCYNTRCPRQGTMHERLATID